MAVEDFLNTYRQSMMNRKPINPLSNSANSLVNKNLEVNPERRGPAPQASFGQKIPSWLDMRKSNAINSYMSAKSERTTDLASDYSQKAAGQVPVDEFGIVQDKSSDFNPAFNSQLESIGNRGKAAMLTDQSRAEWQRLQGLQEVNAGLSVNWTPGASGGNPGAKAVALAMTAAQNGTPYKWGGNSLTTGVDCSGLVQQVYKQMGISLPRTTYEQAKYGKVVSMGSLLPGDLVFYNTGSRDPNGIGNLSHVAIYIGNGQVVEAPGRGKNVRVSKLNYSGTPARAVRPW
jgi:cell wall-associated NlpC family hydrolase